jgi:transcription-repair coupling factor (superfamily II helicase)
MTGGTKRIRAVGLVGSSAALAVAAVFESAGRNQFVILQDKESAAYFLNDLENLFEELNAGFSDKKVLFFPSSYKRPDDYTITDPGNVLLRTEVLNRLKEPENSLIAVSYPEALSEKVADADFFGKHSLGIRRGEEHAPELLEQIFHELGFDKVDFVVEPGQFAVRGGIVDIFSFSNDNPFRVELFGDHVESIRSFDPVSQLSINMLSHIRVVPDMNHAGFGGSMGSVLSYMDDKTVIWIDDAEFMAGRMDHYYDKALEFSEKQEEGPPLNPEEKLVRGKDFLREIMLRKVVEFGRHAILVPEETVEFNITPQPSFNKNFDLLLGQMQEFDRKDYQIVLLSDTRSQLDRLQTIIRDLTAGRPTSRQIRFESEQFILHEGFIDHGNKLCCFTDHQIFDRYHRFRLRDSYSRREAITLKEIFDLKPGDYVTHVDHGIGRYGGLEKIEVNGRQQEAIRIVYANNDLLYVSIHSLHRIAKYAGKDGSVPQLNRLGSNAWNRLKNRTKQRVKDIAKDLIALYARRKATQGLCLHA